MQTSMEHSAAAVQARLDELSWYHTIDVLGATTKGWFDLRHALDLMPFPDVTGKRCLDVGTWDGFYAWEMERRGAAEVVALDIEDLADLDYPPEVRNSGRDLSQSDAQPRMAGFNLIRELLESEAVRWKGGNIYDLSPEVHGHFDVVIVGSLLVHLRDPVRAMDAVRSVTDGELLVADYLHPPVELLSRRRPLFELRGEKADFQWWLASSAGIRQVLKVAGFDESEASKRFLLRPGPRQKQPRGPWRHELRWTAAAVLTGDRTRGGHLHRAFRCRPRF